MLEANAESIAANNIMKMLEAKQQNVLMNQSFVPEKTLINNSIINHDINLLNYKWNPYF